MGAAVSAARRARRGVTSTILAPFKRRGYYLTAAEVRARNPTYYDKVVSDDYLFEPEALARLRRNHKDAFRRLRKRLVDTIPDTLARARYMERYRARHPFRPSARVADPKISFAPVGATRVPPGRTRRTGSRPSTSSLPARFRTNAKSHSDADRDPGTGTRSPGTGTRSLGTGTRSGTRLGRPPPTRLGRPPPTRLGRPPPTSRARSLVVDWTRPGRRRRTTTNPAKRGGERTCVRRSAKSPNSRRKRRRDARRTIA